MVVSSCEFVSALIVVGVIDEMEVVSIAQYIYIYPTIRSVAWRGDRPCVSDYLINSRLPPAYVS